MHYTEVTFLLSPVTPWREILMVELAELGFDSFEESHTDPGGELGELKAYIPSDRFNSAELRALITLRDPHVRVSWTQRDIAPRNWNAEWESSFQPVEVEGTVRIRAEHHPIVEGFMHDLVITPRMAFGTGHHATTRLMVRAMLGLDLAGKAVCDLGCGTGVLAILAARMGARPVVAIDNDAWAVDNARENVRRNGCPDIAVEKGDAASLAGRSYDVILANIERSVLIHAMPLMAKAMRPAAFLLLSGFLPADVPLMERSAAAEGLKPVAHTVEGDWAMVMCQRTDPR